MNNTPAPDHQIPVNLKTTEGRQAPMCIPQNCDTTSIQLTDSNLVAREKFIRPPVRNRECCAGVPVTENIPYFTVETKPPA